MHAALAVLLGPPGLRPAFNQAGAVARKLVARTWATLVSGTRYELRGSRGVRFAGWMLRPNG